MHIKHFDLKLSFTAAGGDEHRCLGWRSHMLSPNTKRSAGTDGCLGAGPSILKSQSFGPCKLLSRPQNPAIETCANIRRAVKTCDFWTSKPFCQTHHPIIPSSFIIFLVAKVQAKNRRNVEVLYEYLMHRLYVGELGESLILRSQHWDIHTLR